MGIGTRSADSDRAAFRRNFQRDVYMTRFPLDANETSFYAHLAGYTFQPIFPKEALYLLDKVLGLRLDVDPVPLGPGSLSS